MTPPGDQARVTALVRVEPVEAFRIFTQEIDLWWRRGLAYRVAGKRRGVICIEPEVGGRLFELFETCAGVERVIETGKVLAWEPPHRLVLEWRPVNFKPDEVTEVEVEFAPSPSGTQVTVTHRGWSRIRGDHPARHGKEVGPFVADLGRWWGDLLTSLRERADVRACRARRR